MMKATKMTNAKLVVLSAILLAGCASANPKNIESATAALAERSLEFGVTHFIQSEIYDGPREINVYAPAAPDWAETPLPVLYVVDGGINQDFFHIAGLSQLSLVNAEKAPLIVVGVKTDNRRVELTPSPMDPRYQKLAPFAGGADDFRRFLIDEVKPFIEARYETGQQALIGESLAGLFIADVFLREPDGFNDYISISPSLWWDDQHLAANAATLLAAHDDDRRRLYLTMADEGGTMRAGLNTLIAAIEANKPAGLDWKFIDRASDDRHSTIYHHSARDALNWLYGMPAVDYGPPPWYLRPGGQPEDDE